MGIDKTPFTSTSAGTGLLVRLGPSIKTFYDIETNQATWTSNLDSMMDAYISGSDIQTSARWHDTLGNLRSQVDSHVVSMDSWKGEIIRRTEETIIDVVNKSLKVDVGDIDEALDYVIDTMRSSSITVDANTIEYKPSGGAFSEVASTDIHYLLSTGGGHEDGTANTGTCVLNIRGKNFYTSVTPFNEGLVRETARIRCVGDKDAGGTAGQETFEIIGQPERAGVEVYASEAGAGGGVTMNVAGDGGILTNGNFETLSTDCPASWTIENTAGIIEGVHVLQSTDTVLRTTSNALQFVGSCSGNQIHGVYQTITPTPGIYTMGVWMLGSTLSVGTDIRVGLWNVDTCGWYANTLTATATIDVTQGSLTNTDWTLHTKTVELTNPLPGTMYFKLKTTGLGGAEYLANGEKVTFAEAVLTPPADYNGLLLTVLRGSSNPIVGDQWIMDVSNDHAGIYQTFFTRVFGRQLPSATANEIISDTNAD